jgi:hypothetical protein
VPWIGLRKGCVEEKDIEKYLMENGIHYVRKIELEVQVGDEWVPFLVFEVLGMIEGFAEEMSHTFNCPSLESGPHLVLGEISAKLWDEGAKIIFPDGSQRIIPIYTFDAFLDVRMPTNKVKGLKGQIIIAGNIFDLPLTLEDLAKIEKMGKKYIEKVEKAASVYGVTKILSSEVREKLLEKEKKEIKYEVDYDAGLALVMIGNKLQTVTIPRLVILLAEEKMYEQIKEVYSSAPEPLKKKLKESLLEYYEFKKANRQEKESLEKLFRDIGITTN